jgi:phosphohistidine swiveling domain-containing protein
MSAENSTKIYSGLGAAPGRASGKAYVIRNAEDIMAVPAGSILVMRILHPHLAPLLPRVAGLVVEEGAILQHATTLARECGIPAAVGIRDARCLFHDGDLLDLDGYTGKVIARHVDRSVIPLTDLGSAQYLGFAGGLYPNEKNSPPSAYEQAGVALGAAVQALDRDGKPSASGKIVMISIGMSNASREFSQFIRLADADARKNANLVMIDAARNRAAATDIALPFGDYWRHVDSQLERCEVSATQVQVVWLKSALAYEARGFPEKARLLQQALRSTVEILTMKFPQLKLVYVSSRIYGGYSETDLSPEPIAYESAFAVKWLIEKRINNPGPDRSTPWVSWGPYLWADGLTPRSDGLTWERGDFEPDGVHPSAQGVLKVATMLLEFFQKDTAAKPWFFSLMP